MNPRQSPAWSGDPSAAAGSSARTSELHKRSAVIGGRGTSLALEPEFWAVLRSAADKRRIPLNRLIAEIDAGRGERPLASACRVSALRWAMKGKV
jgi:predicted DNA-binding ribbon-helix-helix protein